MTAYFLSFCACQRNDSDNNVNTVLPLAQTVDFVKDGCLNIQVLQQLFNQNRKAFPAIQVTTDFVVLSNVSQIKKQFYTHSAFDLKETDTRLIHFLLNPTQVGCSEVISQSASKEVLKFKVIKSNQNILRLRIIKSESNQLMQVYELELTSIGPHHIQVVSWYKSLDFHCRGTDVITFEIHQDFFWASQKTELPVEITLNKLFLTQYLTTFEDEIKDQVQSEIVSVEFMKKLNMQSLKNEVSQCR